MELIDIVIDFLPLFMFLSLAVLLFTGYPVAFILGGLALLQVEGDLSPRRWPSRCCYDDFSLMGCVSYY